MSLLSDSCAGVGQERSAPTPTRPGTPKNGGSLAERAPEVADEWDYAANAPLTPWDITYMSGSKRHWRCQRFGHAWEAKVCARSAGSGCPVCAGKKVLSGFNDLATLFPDVAGEFDVAANGCSASDVLAGTKARYQWRCHAHGHAWTNSVQKRTLRGDGCPTCSNRVLLRGFNDLATCFPNLAAELDETKTGLRAHEIVYGSSIVVSWTCAALGHSWEASIVRRTHAGAGCPVCDGNALLAGYNDLATLHPHLVPEFDVETNQSDPSEVLGRGRQKFAWRCTAFGHQWYASVENRVRARSGCGVCASKQVLIGFNDLGTLFPDVAAEWDFERNGGLTPHDVTFGSGKRRYWRCSLGHQWGTAVANRTVSNTGCPRCAEDAGWGTSLAEKRLRDELARRYTGTRPAGGVVAAIRSRRAAWNCDIIIDAPDGRLIVVEYDGDTRGHSNLTESVDTRKSDDIRSQGHILIRVRAGTLLPLHPHDVRAPGRRGHHSNAAWMAEQVAARLAELGMPADLAPVPAAV